MKQLKYLNAVLTVIATCLVLITFAVTGVFPKANANDGNNLNAKRLITVPLNADGSLNVKITNSVMDVNIKEINSSSISGQVPVNIEEVGGHTVHSSLPVENQ
jgi:predicted metal-dependent RNase